MHQRLRYAILVRTAAAAAVVIGSTAAARGQTADEIVEKHLAALGGRDAVKRLSSRVAKGTITLTLPIATLQGKVEQFIKSPNKQRTLITLDLSGFGAGQATWEQRFDGTTGQVLDSVNGNRDITGPQLALMRATSFPTPLLDYRAAGGTLTVIGKEAIGGREAHLLEAVLPAVPPVRLWIDAESFMLVRTSVKVEVQELGQTIEQVTEYADFRDVDGIKVPFSVSNINPVQSSSSLITEVTHNTAIDDAIFAKR